MYQNNIFSWCFNGNLKKQELSIERSKVHIFDRENGNSVLKMIDYVKNNFEGKPRYVINKYGIRIPSSYKYQMTGHNASGFDIYSVLNTLPSSYNCIKILKSSGGLINLNFKAQSVIEDDKKIPKNMKFVCSKCHISGPLCNIQKEYNIQPDL